MKSERQLRKKLAELKADERVYYQPATVFENAPLALIQLGLETEINLLEQILEIPLSTFPLKKRNAIT